MIVRSCLEGERLIKSSGQEWNFVHIIFLFVPASCDKDSCSYTNMHMQMQVSGLILRLLRFWFAI